MKTNDETMSLFELNESYTEILKLDRMLTEAKIPHALVRLMDGWQVIYPDVGIYDSVADAVENTGSYGHEKNLLEIMGLLTDEEARFNSVKGWLTAEDVFERIEKHYKQYGEKV